MRPSVIPEWTEARRFFLPVAMEKQWTDADIKAAWAIMDRAAEGAADGISFWRELRRSWVANVPKNPPATWPDLLPVWAAAIDEEIGEEEKEWVTSFLGKLTGTVTKTAEEVKEVGKAIPDVVKIVGVVVAVVVGAAVLLGGKKGKIKL